MPDSKWRRAFWIVLVAALLLRLVNFAVLADSAALRVGDHANSDLTFFANWADRIAGGDLLTDHELHPLHRWHEEVAGRYLEKHPEQTGGVHFKNLADDAILGHYRTVWNRWYGGKRFHQEPLYPYTLALIRTTLGPDKIWWQFLQMVLGLATLVLLHAITRAAFGDPAALAAMTMATLCGPLLCFELFMLRATAIATASLLLVYLTMRATHFQRPRSWLLFGLCTGLAMTLKAPLVLLGIAGALIAIGREQPGRMQRWGWFTLGAALAFAPILIRNLIVGASPFSSSSVAAVTFAVTNHANYPGLTWIVDYAALADVMGQSEGGLFATISATLGSHASLGSYLALLWTKWCQVWHWPELPNNFNWYFVQRHSPILAWAPVTFTVIAGFALIGLGAAIRRWRAVLPLLVLVALTVAPLVALYVVARFRVPLLIALLPFAGFGLARTWHWFTTKQFKLVALAILGAGLWVAWIQRPEQKGATLLGYIAYLNAEALYYEPEWGAAALRKDWPRAEELMRHAIAARPDYLDDLRPGVILTARHKYELSNLYAKYYAQLSASLRKRDQAARAAAAMARSRELERVVRDAQENRRRQRPR